MRRSGPRLVGDADPVAGGDARRRVGPRSPSWSRQRARAGELLARAGRVGSTGRLSLRVGGATPGSSRPTGSPRPSIPVASSASGSPRRGRPRGPTRSSPARPNRPLRGRRGLHRERPPRTARARCASRVLAQDGPRRGGAPAHTPGIRTCSRAASSARAAVRCSGSAARREEARRSDNHGSFDEAALGATLDPRGSRAATILHGSAGEVNSGRSEPLDRLAELRGARHPRAVGSTWTRPSAPSRGWRARALRGSGGWTRRLHRRGRDAERPLRLRASRSCATATRARTLFLVAVPASGPGTASRRGRAGEPHPGEQPPRPARPACSRRCSQRAPPW